MDYDRRGRIFLYKVLYIIHFSKIEIICKKILWRNSIGMKRLCIFSIYDPEGQIDEYIYYWLKEFREVCDEIIAISNGRLKTGHLLSQYAEQIIVRNNMGFDGGAYADVLTNHLSYEKIQEFDEIILCNDTCYGPFVPMQEIFSKMESKENDFWGIQLWNEGYAHWINSFFLAFRKNVIKNINWFKYFKEHIDQKAFCMAEAYGNYEMGMYLWLTKNNYHYDYYAIPTGNHCMKCPDYFIEKCHFPFLKKRAFCPEHYHEDNLRKALALIHNTGYELKWIIDNISRKYDISNEIKLMAETNKMNIQYLKQETKEYSVDMAFRTPEEIIDFIQKNNDKDMYIYGAGAFGSRIYLLYRSYMKNFKGFVVSQKSMDNIMGEKMNGIDEIDLDKSAIVIGMDKKNTAEVLKNKLTEAKFVLNLYEKTVTVQKP